MSTLGRQRGRLVLVAIAVLVAFGTTACLDTPGSTDQIVEMSTTESNGWTVRYFENRAYPCSISGYQTFVVATKVGSDDQTVAPLWVYMHGGGVGHFNAQSQAQRPSFMDQEGSAQLSAKLQTGLVQRLAAQPGESYRLMSVSYCSHDLYAGTNTTDLNNPDPARTTNGQLATNAAIRFVTQNYPTNDFFLHGGSAGSAGTFHNAWALQRQGLTPAGIVADSGVINFDFELVQQQIGSECARGQEEGELIMARWDSEVADPANQPHLLVSSGRLTVPIMQVWSLADKNPCGAEPTPCPTASGATVQMNAADCQHELLRSAIEDQGPSGRSTNLRLCVDDTKLPEACDKHVATNIDGVSTVGPPDYNGAIIDWVNERRADDTD